MISWILLGLTNGAFIVYLVRQSIMKKKAEALQAQVRNNLGHYAELWDLGPYHCMHDVPLSNITQKCAWPVAHCYNTPMPTDEERKIRKKVK